MKEYDKETLKKVQDLEMEILRDFLKICEDNNLTYFGFAGTGIGALRHKGFIPWDDDIDIALPRKDYEILIQAIKDKMSDKYMIGNAENMKNYPLMTTRIMLKGTKFVEEALKDIKCDFGIFLDIYAFDNVPDKKKEFKRQAYKAWFWSKILILRHVAFPVLPFKGIKRKIVYAICGFVHAVLVLFRISPTWIYKKCKKASCLYNNKETNHMAFLCGTTPFNNIINKNKAFPLIKLDFQDVQLYFPKDIHDMLVKSYGDYMQLPPVEKRKNHFPHQLDFGKYEK